MVNRGFLLNFPFCALVVVEDGCVGIDTSVLAGFEQYVPFR